MSILADLRLSRGDLAIPGFLAAVFESELPDLMAHPEQLLHPNEQAHAATLRFPVRRNSYLLGRFAAKQAVVACLGHITPSAIEIGKGVFEQPIVLIEDRNSAEVSLAHSHGVAIAVACKAGHPAGIDIEYMASRKVDFFHKSFNDHERKQIADLGLCLETGYYLLWTMKEALSKVLRCGLMVPCETLEVVEAAAHSTGAFQARFQNFPQYKVHAWILERYALSLVLPQRTSLQFRPGAELAARMAQAGLESGSSPGREFR